MPIAVPPRRAGSPLRVAYILPGFGADEEDWCIPVFTNLVRSVALRAEVVVYPLHYPFRRGSYRAFGADIHGLSERKRRGFGRLMQWRELELHLKRLHRKAPFDLIHGFWATETGYLASGIARRLGIPSVVSLAGGEMARIEGMTYGAQKSPIHRRLVDLSLTRATAVTAGSGWLAGLAPERIGEKLTVLPFGVDTEMFAPAPPRSGTQLLAAASMIPLKDYPTLFQAITTVRRTIPGVELEVAGAGPEMERLRRSVYELGLEEIIRFAGLLPYEEMPDACRRASLFIHASRYEAQGMVTLEALATGLPVVSTRVGVAADLPDHLVYTTSPGNAGEMAAAIIRSLSTPVHAHRTATEGVDLIRRTYSLPAVTDKLLTLYSSLLS